MPGLDERNDAAPHICPECGSPAYLGVGVPGKCVQRGCVFYDATLWSEWVMLVPDLGDPPQDELDFGLEFEDTFPGFAQQDSALDDWGAVLGVPRNFCEDDQQYARRLLDAWGRQP